MTTLHAASETPAMSAAEKATSTALDALRRGEPVLVAEDLGGNGAAMIATVYLAGTICLFPYTGASMNPTRSFGPQMFSNLDCDSFSNVW